MRLHPNTDPTAEIQLIATMWVAQYHNDQHTVDAEISRFIDFLRKAEPEILEHPIMMLIRALNNAMTVRQINLALVVQSEE